ncbi:protein SIP5 [Helicocarpus griseus UAMH5409]|uniref:Protein SIP5 n=1 Tax=Helicocarpus griseus UAMH5409 TaxID=1447875 RepID=A0A2B7WLA8_9EURO|nr:protein SIP5 [Helicocarpus griseus UAMH5409]
MGNTATKEARPSLGHPGRHGHARGSSAGATTHGGQGLNQYPSEGSNPGGSSRHLRGSRGDLSFLGIGPAVSRDAPVERRETKQEREARRLEKERIARVKERERSMREEHVDGGYLVTHGVYTGPEDYNKAVVRQLMIERRLAPFWKGLEEFSESWTEHQLMAAARGLPIPAPDEIPPELEYKLSPRPPEERDAPERNLNNLTVPISSRSQSYNSDTSSGTHPTSPAIFLQPQLSPSGSASPSANIFRGRAKTLASLTSSSKATSPAEMAPRELQLPKDPFVNGQPIEAYLYKNPTECPICFLYCPPYLNKTRCCDQPICSECFVQIKRADPHPPEHEERDEDPPQPSNQQDGQLISEPAACPFCVQPEFGVSYSPPHFRRGLSYIPSHGLSHLLNSPASSTSSLASGNANPQSTSTRRRATSLSANSPIVITTDKIRPDWAQKLQTARAHAARRSAAATALHTAAYLMHNPNDSRGTASSSRRMLRRTTGQGSDSPTNQASSLAFLTERRPALADRENDSPGQSTAHLAPARTSSTRRVDELEEMMMMEAIRLSLASEEERRKKEEKEAKKAAKRREKDAKKAEKYARKNGPHSNNPSLAALEAAGGSSTANRIGGEPQPLVAAHESSSGKGKGVDRPASLPSPDSPQSDPQPAGAPKLTLKSSGDGDLSSILNASSTATAKRPHLRHISSASSSNSSLVESSSGEQIGSDSGSNANNTAIQPLLSFRSLDAVVDDENKGGNSSEHVEGVKREDPLQPSNAGTGVTKSNSDLELAPDQNVPLSPLEEGSSLSKDDNDLGKKEMQPHSVEIMPDDARNMETAS